MRYAVQYLAAVAAALDVRQSARLTGYVDHRIEEIGESREWTEQHAYGALMRTLHEKLPESELAALMAEGAALDEERAIEEALSV